MVPVLQAIIPADYPELTRLAWNRDPARPITGEEALGLYERNWRHADTAALSQQERALIAALADRFGRGHLLTTKQGLCRPSRDRNIGRWRPRCGPWTMTC
jgi:hypothetical protein